MKKGKILMAAAAVTVCIAFPAYRYYLIGSLLGYRILGDKPKYRVVPKQSRPYKRLVGVKHGSIGRAV